jgi:uncharacterized protein YjbI with pentapeptide repeats
VAQWQQTCCKLIGYLLRKGLPMEEFSGLTFYEMNNRAIQAEIALLALLNACASCTKKLSEIDWIDHKTFGTWLARMQEQRDYGSRSIVAICLSWLNRDGAILVGASLVGASLDGASLDGARLDRARLVEASLVGASLVEASLVGARLDRASLVEASLVGARLDRASLQNISWDENTNWQDAIGLERAINVPDRLKQQLGLP